MNILLDDTQREEYKDIIELLFKLCPDTMQRKMVRANVQQAFVFNMVGSLYKKNCNILSIGSHEDTAYEALKQLRIDVIGIDPLLNVSLGTFYEITRDKFDIIFSTSVIEHVKDDELFIEQICKLLKPEGYAILTCDFRNDWKEGEPKPSEDFRLYTKQDLTVRLNNILKQNGCEMYGEINYEGEPDFAYGVYWYSFGTFCFKKNDDNYNYNGYN